MYIRILKTLGRSFILTGLILVTSCNREEEKPATNYPARQAISSKVADSTETKSATVQRYSSLAYKLASINAGQNVLSSDPSIKKFDDLLAELASKYVEDEQRIADITVKSHGMLKDAGISTPLLDMMQGMNQLVSKKDAVNKYADYMAAYHTLRKSGDSHEDAVLNVKALLKSMGVQ